ncbi:MAG: SEC-C domain-containing protein, partial [Alphaproteobacteria bacterium]|nr:SEC-C domain-containing protein [Alphaproteobacteria bacterium]
KEGEAIIHPWINKALEKAQQKVEARNFDIRKNLLRFDNVMNDQRKVIYEQRREIMTTDNVHETVLDMREHVLDEIVSTHMPEKALPDQWDTAGLHTDAQRLFALELPVSDWAREEGIADDEIHDRIAKAIEERMASKAANWGPELMRLAEKSVLLQLLDQYWKDHLLQLDHLRQGIGLRAYAQRDPLNEYKSEAFELFEAMLAHLREGVTSALSHLELRQQEVDMPQSPDGHEWQERHDETSALELADAEAGPAGPSPATAQAAQPARAPAPRPAFDAARPETWGKVARNAPCPCGSGRKYKHCHGQN